MILFFYLHYCHFFDLISNETKAEHLLDSETKIRSIHHPSIRHSELTMQMAKTKDRMELMF